MKMKAMHQRKATMKIKLTNNVMSTELLENIEKKLTETQNEWKIEMKENMNGIKSSNNNPAEDNRNHVDEIIKRMQE